MGGSLCEPLCVRREVEFVRCLGHGVKMHVLQAQWAANTVVLKTPKPLGDHRATMHLYGPNKYQTKISKKEFIADVSERGLGLNLFLSDYVYAFPLCVLCVLCRPTRLCT